MLLFLPILTLFLLFQGMVLSIATQSPTETPTLSPTESPTFKPTAEPTHVPSPPPTFPPTTPPTPLPTYTPTQLPTMTPVPTPLPSPFPTKPSQYWTTSADLSKGYVQQSSLEFIPPVRCMPTEIVLRFTTDFNLTGGDQVAVGLSGFTSGECDNFEGDSIAEEFSEITGYTTINEAFLLVSPFHKFTGGYREGDLAMGFSNSRLVFTLKPGTHYRNGTEVVIRVDQGNKLKANCGIDAGGNENFTLAIRALALGPRVNKYDQRIKHVTAVTTAVVNESTKIEGDCPVTDATVSIIPPMPQKLMDMIISFRTGMHLNPGDNITIFLGGLTNGNMSGGVFVRGYDVPLNPGLDITSIVSRYSKVILDYTFRSPKIFNASWTEGEPAEFSGEPGFNTSRLKLFVNPGFHFKPGAKFDIMVNKSQKVVVYCGLRSNYEHFKIKVDVKYRPEYPRSKGTNLVQLQQTPRGGSKAIGEGCRSHQNFCNGNGFCDMCRNRCVCFKGFGADEDLFDRRAKASDCAGRVCPTGPSFTNFKPKVNINTSASAGFSTKDDGRSLATGGRVVAECSGVGTCNYDMGHCNCPDGFAGRACERRTCPNGNDNSGPCSGHGECMSMRNLALMDNALPLANIPPFGPSAVYATAGGVLQSPASWDARAIFGCVCDSSWPVGLGANETQEPEYFGPDCSLRHCPSGDDPLTLTVDETNCTGVLARGAVNGRGESLSDADRRVGARALNFSSSSSFLAGAVGNRCHVDCSNRGTCDYSTGECTCFKGFYGANCGTRVQFQQAIENFKR